MAAGSLASFASCFLVSKLRLPSQQTRMNLQVDMNGLTGRIQFDKGTRTHFSLDILQLQPKGLTKVSV